MRHSLFTTTAASLGLAALALLPALAQDTPTPPALAAPPGPATAPPPPPGTAVPAPQQPAAQPTPPGTASGSSPAPAAPAAPPPNYKIQYNGLIDGYLQYSFQNPHGTLLDNGLASGAYNARIKTPTLQLAEINVFENAKPSGLGFKTTLIAGDAADQNHLNFNFANGASIQSTSESQFKNIQQLYGTYAFAGAGGGIDVGKFYTPFGYEVTEANADYNYTRSLPYNLLPFYNTGIRVYSPSYNGLVVTGYAVNAIINSTNEGVHRRGDVGYIGQANFTDPKGKFTAIGTVGYGKVKPGDIKIADTFGDADFTYNLNANQLFGLNYTYAKSKPSGDNGSFVANGYAAYYRQALTPKTAFALRFSGFDAKTDTPAVANDDETVTPASTTHLRPYEFTGTYEYKPAANFTARLEYRHDSSNQQSYLGHGDSGDTGPSKKNEDLLLLAGLFTF